MDRRTAIGQIGSLNLLLLSGSTGLTRSHTSKPIRIGQVGVGHPHASKLSVYRASEAYEVVGIVEPNPDLRKRSEGQAPFRDLPWLTMEQLLNTKGLEAVLIETPVRDLLTTAERCIQAGLHVHVDKPAGSSLPLWRTILTEAKKKDLLVQMGYMYRYNPGFLLLKEMLRQGWLGDLFEVHSVMSKTIDDASRRELTEFKGGIFFELACHVMDLVIAILGKPSNVQGVMRHSADKSDGLIDNGLAILSYPRAIATVKSSAIEFGGNERRHLVVCGTEGSIHIQPLDNPTATLTLSQARGNFRAGSQTIPFPKFTRYVADAADMAKIIRKEKESDFSYQHDIDVQEALLQACGMDLE